MDGSATAEDRYRKRSPRLRRRPARGNRCSPRPRRLRSDPQSRLRNPVVPELSEHDARILDEAGFTGDRTAATIARLDRDICISTLVHNSKTIDAAAHLGVAPARIRQRITAGTLWAFDSGRQRLLLPEQFTDTGEVPHLDKIMPSIAKDLHPLTVQALLTSHRTHSSSTATRCQS